MINDYLNQLYLKQITAGHCLLHFMQSRLDMVKGAALVPLFWSNLEAHLLTNEQVLDLLERIPAGLEIVSYNPYLETGQPVQKSAEVLDNRASTDYYGVVPYLPHVRTIHHLLRTCSIAKKVYLTKTLNVEKLSEDAILDLVLANTLLTKWNYIGTAAIDAGGVAKDMAIQLGLTIMKRKMVLVNDFYLPKPDLPADEASKLGRLVSKLIHVDQKFVDVNVHPLICILIDIPKDRSFEQCYGELNFKQLQLIILAPAWNYAKGDGQAFLAEISERYQIYLSAVKQFAAGYNKVATTKIQSPISTHTLIAGSSICNVAKLVETLKLNNIEHLTLENGAKKKVAQLRKVAAEVSDTSDTEVEDDEEKKDAEDDEEEEEDDDEEDDDEEDDDEEDDVDAEKDDDEDENKEGDVEMVGNDSEDDEYSEIVPKKKKSKKMPIDDTSPEGMFRTALAEIIEQWPTIKRKELFRYWFGTTQVERGTINFSRAVKGEYAVSHTCSNTLDFPPIAYANYADLRAKIDRILEHSLQNQRFAQLAQLNFQQA
jgi:hypothetical protein